MADWQYIVLKPAQKYLERMQPDEQVRMIAALDTLLTKPESLDIKPLKVGLNCACGWVNIGCCLLRIEKIKPT